jgi:type II secretory pathway predicted ATPase ExeA
MVFGERATAATIAATRTRAVDAVLEVTLLAPLTIVTGEAGTGKTTLCLALAKRSGPRSLGSIALTAPSGADALLGQLSADFGIVGFAASDWPVQAPPGEEDESAALRMLFEALAAIHRRAFLIFDDAHDLSPEVVTEILRICSVAAGASAPVHVVLVGRPSLDALLERPDVRPRLEGLAIRRHSLAPPRENELQRFIERRLWAAYGGIARPRELAGAPPRLTRSAGRAIARASQGDLRVASAICDRIAATAGRRSRPITGSRASRVLTDLGLAKAQSPLRRPLTAVAAVLAIALAATAFPGASRLKKPGVPTLVHRSPITTPWVGLPLALRPATVVPNLREDPQQQLAAPEPAAAPESFDALRTDALDRAARLSAVPDVRGLLRLQDAVSLWNSQTNGVSHAAVEELLKDLHRFTNDARYRQLLHDGQQFRSANR